MTTIDGIAGSEKLFWSSGDQNFMWFKTRFLPFKYLNPGLLLDLCYHKNWVSIRSIYVGVPNWEIFPFDRIIWGLPPPGTSQLVCIRCVLSISSAAAMRTSTSSILSWEHGDTPRWDPAIGSSIPNFTMVVL